MGIPKQKPRLVTPDLAKQLASPSEFPDWAIYLAESLMTALRERDPYTYGHCRRVSRHAKLLAKAAGLPEHEQRIVEYSSLFHDLGKMGIPDRILLKPGRLTDEEEAIMREHPVRSVNILASISSQVPFIAQTLPGIRHHHERLDGRGYPDGIAGDQIPLTSRVILIADTFDAMTTTRPYRKALPDEVAFKELKQFAGRQFDPHLVKIFIESYSHWGVLEEEITETFVASHFKRAA